MENLLIAEKSQTALPYISFDASTGHCIIEGDSYMENAFEFYEALNNWITAYCQTSEQPLHIKVKLTYFNTSSSRCLLDFFRTIQKQKSNGQKVEVAWYYPDPDSDLLMDGEDFMYESGLDMEFKLYD